MISELAVATSLGLTRVLNSHEGVGLLWFSRVGLVISDIRSR